MTYEVHQGQVWWSDLHRNHSCQWICLRRPGWYWKTDVWKFMISVDMSSLMVGDYKSLTARLLIFCRFRFLFRQFVRIFFLSLLLLFSSGSLYVQHQQKRQWIRIMTLSIGIDPRDVFASFKNGQYGKFISRILNCVYWRTLRYGFSLSSPDDRDINQSQRFHFQHTL